MSKLLENMTISNTKTRVGIIIQSRNPEIVYMLGELSKKQKVLNALPNLQLTSTGNDMQKLTNLLEQRFFKESNGARKDASKVIVFFTNGELKEGSTELSAMKSKGVKIIVVAYGKDLDANSYIDAASDANSLFTVEGKDELDKIADDVENKIFTPSMICS